MSSERIVSFLPSVTELLYELGASNKIVGVTHECLYPNEAPQKPRIINSVFDANKLDSKEINEKILELSKTGKPIFKINEENLTKANPDLIISQNICDVCSANSNHVEAAISLLDTKPKVYTIDPHDLNDILKTITEISRIIDKKAEGIKLVNSLKNRIDVIKNTDFRIRPKVLCIEWIEPFYSAGHWVPQMVKIAGGNNLVSSTGERSRAIDIETISKCQPDIIIIMPCGFDISRTRLEYKKFLKYNKRWNDLTAVKTNKIFAVDANSYFSKPSLRTITGLEMLAKIIHPEIFTKINPPNDSISLI